MSTGQFRPGTWDPFLAVSQIISIQAMWYTSLGILVFVSSCLTSLPPSLDYVFDYRQLSMSPMSKFLVVSYLFNSLCGSLYLWHILQRAKPCLDFSATIHVIHLFVCWMYNGCFPINFSWWLLNLICVSITCVCGEFLCMKTEMKSIPLLSNKSDV